MNQKSVAQPDFDTEINRKAVHSLKFNSDQLISVFGRDDLWPSWVADMDFKSAPTIQNALTDRLNHGVFGYESNEQTLKQAIVKWYQQQHNWTFHPDQIQFSPRTLASIAVLISLFTQPNEGIIIQPPVFYDFKLLIKAQDRRLIKNPLILEQGQYKMDFDHLESLAEKQENTLLILCNPHNPIGRVWSRSELFRLHEICYQYGVFVVADEIHGDLAYQKPYTAFASLSESAADHSATCISPNKSFNLAGVSNSMIVIQDEARHHACKAWFNRYEINKNNVFSNTALLSAYTDGLVWLNQLKVYLQENIATLKTFLNQHIPSVGLIEPEGTYLLWLDFRKLEMDAKELELFLSEQAHIASNPGHWFGREGAGFARINIACPRNVLLHALQNLEKAVHSLQQDKGTPKQTPLSRT